MSDSPHCDPRSRCDDTFHIRLNMQISSKYWGWPDQQHTRDVFSFKIDHVKVYQGKQVQG